MLETIVCAYEIWRALIQRVVMHADDFLTGEKVSRDEQAMLDADHTWLLALFLCHVMIASG